MARSFVSTSSQVAFNGGLSSPVKPTTFVARVKINNSSDLGNQYIFSWGDWADGQPALLLRYRHLGSKKIVLVDQGDSAGSSFVSSSNSYTDGVWLTVAGLFVGESSRRVYLDGTLTSDTELRPQTLSQIDRVAIGAQGFSSTFAFYADISVAEAAIYNIELSLAELDMLNLGLAPELVRPENIIHQWRLVDGLSPEIDIVGRAELTLNNSPAFEDHPSTAYASKTLQPPTKISSPPHDPRPGVAVYSLGGLIQV